MMRIVPAADYVYYTRPAYSRAASPESLMAMASGMDTPGEKVDQITKALDRAKKMADPDDLIVVCGSLFTVGEALAHIEPEAYEPDQLMK